MFPLFHIGPYIEVHFFGLCLVLAWWVFFWLLHKHSLESGVSRNTFGNIALYTLSIFFWSRIMYMMTDWRNEKYLFVDLIEQGNIGKFLHGFFITENYNLSLAGWILGFFLVLSWYIIKGRTRINRVIDIIARSFFWAGLIGYIGALLGWQVYGMYFDSFFSLVYWNKNSIVPIGSARFPLPIVYMLLCLFGALLIEKVRKTFKLPEGFIWYIGFGFFGVFLFLFEFLSGSSDMFASYPPYIGVNQIVWLIFVGFSLIWIMKSTKF